MSYAMDWLETGLTQDEALKRVKRFAHTNKWSYRTKKLSDGSIKIVLRKKD